MLANDLPIEKLAWFAASSAIGSASAGCGYLSRSGERSLSAATVACANGLLIGLFASLLASRYTDCDPVWLVLGSMAMGWPSGLIGVVRTITAAWSLRLQILALINAANSGWQATLKQLQDGMPPAKPSPPAIKPDDDSSSREQSS